MFFFASRGLTRFRLSAYCPLKLVLMYDKIELCGFRINTPRQLPVNIREVGIEEYLHDLGR